MSLMATTTQMNEERRLIGELGRALDTLEKTTDVKAKVVALEVNKEKTYQPDAEIEVMVNGTKYRYFVEVKAHIDRLAPIGHIKAQLDQLGGRGILFAPYITPAIAKQCRQLGLAFLDMAGNAYLHEPGLHVYVTGEKPEGLPNTKMATRGGGTATALRVIFALVCEPKLLNAPYREIVEAANVALGAIGWIFVDLEKRGLIAGRQKAHNRRFLERKRLTDEWVTNYPIKLRPKLHPRRFRAENPEWWKHADLTAIRAYWGGEIAANRLTKYLKPATCTLYIEPDQGDVLTTLAFAKFVVANRLRADPDGDIEILDTFWHLPPDHNHPDIVPPVLAYADLIATLEPRNLEVAKLIREQYLENVVGKT
ncbi:MAG: hypothetical protein RL020_1449 [Pseudomonadota bacterium]